MVGDQRRHDRLAGAVDDLGVFLFGIRRGVRFSRGDDPSVLNDERRIFNGWLPAAVDERGSGENGRRFSVKRTSGEEESCGEEQADRAVVFHGF